MKKATTKKPVAKEKPGEKKLDVVIDRPKHGGARPGAGRPTGSASKRTREIADRAIEEGIAPLEVMLLVMREAVAHNDLDTALEAAKAAGPYIHPRLAAIEHTGKDGEALVPKRLEIVFVQSDDN
jgi:hypothetical protein